MIMHPEAAFGTGLQSDLAPGAARLAAGLAGRVGADEGVWRAGEGGEYITRHEACNESGRAAHRCQAPGIIEAEPERAGPGASKTLIALPIKIEFVTRQSDTPAWSYLLNRAACTITAPVRHVP